jgi:glycosyltransferase involved in cell wall biosynthesis
MKLSKVLFVTPYVGQDTPQSMSFAKFLMTKIQQQGVEVRNLPVSKTINPFVLAGQVKLLRSITREFGQDITVANYGTYTGLLVAMFSRRPRVVIFRGDDLKSTFYLSWIYRNLQLAASHASSFLVDGIICVSHELANLLFVKKPCLICPSPTNLDLFRPMGQEACRKELGWDLNKPIAVFFGYGGREEKRADLAHQVKTHLMNTNVEVELKIFIDLIPLNQMPTYLNAADCMVFVSASEGSPNLIRDACACNLPIVSVPVGDVSQVLADVTPSEIVEPDVRLLSEALTRLSSLRTRSNGRICVERYSGDTIAKRYIEFFSELVSGTYKDASPA